MPSPLSFFRLSCTVSAFPFSLQHRFRLSIAGTTDRIRLSSFNPHNTLHIPTTLTRLSYDNIYEFNNNTLILNNNETINKHYHKDQQHHG